MTINVTKKLGAGPVGTAKYRVSTRVRDHNTLPKRIALSYYDVDLNGAPAIVYSETVRKGGRDVNVNFPVFMRRSEAKNVADRLMLKAWRERIEYTFQATLDMAVYDPGDVIQIQDDETGKLLNLRITELNIDPRGFVTISGVRHDPAVYTNVTEYSDNSAVSPTQAVYDSADFVLFETHDPVYDGIPPTFFIAIKKTENWRGGSIYASLDGGVSWTSFGDESTATFIGTTTTELPPGAWAIRDNTASLRIAPEPGCTYQLSNRAFSEILEGANTFFVNGELIRAESITLLNDGSYELRGIHRGVRGTEHKAGTTIPIGSQIILMEPCIPIQFGQPGDVVEIRIPVSQIGESVNSVGGQQLVINGAYLKGWNTTRHKAVWSGDSLQITWAYRNRFSRDWRGYAELPRDNDFSGYIVEINGITFHTNTESITLIRNTDFPQTANYTVMIRQKTSWVELGYPATFTIEDSKNYFGVV